MAKEPEMKNMGAAPGVPEDDKHPDEKRGGRMHGKRARGGKSEGHVGVQLYNAPDANETKEAEDETPSFRRGGEAHKKRREGGHADGKMAEHRMDRRPRRAAGGSTGGGGSHNPYSSASAMTAPETGSNGRGYESNGPAKK